jgi:hypothetical protein
MSKSLFVAVGLVLVLTGCADTPTFRHFGVRTTNVAYASVQVVSDKVIVVSQEPIFVQQEEDNAIYWSLPQGGTYFFPSTTQNPGIQFDNPQMPRTECKLHNDKWTYVCTYKKANRAKYPYTIRVTKNGTDILKSDPTVMNN